MSSLEILRIAVSAIDEKKGGDIKAIDVGNVCSYADYFIIATGTSSTHVLALSESVEEKLKQSGKTAHRVEGRATDWVLMDYGNVIIHIFGKQAREFYGLERLWEDGAPVDIEAGLKGTETK